MAELNKLTKVGAISGFVSIVIFFMAVYLNSDIKVSAILSFIIMFILALVATNEENNWPYTEIFVANATLMIVSARIFSDSIIFFWILLVLAVILFIKDVLKVRYHLILIRFLPTWLFMFVAVRLYVHYHK